MQPATMSFVLLPGMDGTGRLFEPLLKLGLDAMPIAYSSEVPKGYEALEADIRPLLPERDFLLVAESFSGPLGLRIAADPPPHLRGLLLVNSFARRPRYIPWLPTALMRALFSAPVPRLVLRRCLLGADAPPELVELTREVLRSVSPAVMAARAAALRELDATAALGAIRVPCCHLRSTSDRLVPPRAQAGLQDGLPGLRVETHQGPHLLLQRHPQACLELMRELGQQWGAHAT